MLDDVFTDEFVREAREIAQGVEVREHCIIVRGVREAQISELMRRFALHQHDGLLAEVIAEDVVG
jgi:hypothetical protein